MVAAWPAADSPIRIYNSHMIPPTAPRHRSKTPPPGDTGHEAAYLHSLSERQVQVTVTLRDGEAVRGWIEYFDDGMLRLTREGKPNLFIYKHQVRTITEAGRGRPRKSAAANMRVQNGSRSQAIGK